METRLETCARCGAQIDPETMACPHCPPNPDGGAVDERGAPAVTRTEATAAAAADVVPKGPAHKPPPLPPAALLKDTPQEAEARPPGQRSAGPIEFEAEECLARGDVERALVLASKALKEQPESVTLRALFERARKTVLRGRRGERLEERIDEARERLERDDLTGAERIVASALKLMPNHAAALELFALIKERRLAVPTPEAEAERDLARVAAAQAAQFLRRARTLEAQGSARAAFGAVRRGLRVVPDDKDLLALYGRLEESLARAAARHAALRRRVQEARDLLDEGAVVRSRDVLRGVLRQDPDFVPAQTAMRAVRAAYLEGLARGQAPAAPLPDGRPLPVGPAPPAPSAPAPTAPLVSRLAGSSAGEGGHSAGRTPVPAAAEETATTSLPGRGPRPAAPAPLPAPKAAIPPEVLLPRTRRRATPLALIVAGSILTLGTALFLAFRGLAPRTSPGPRFPVAVSEGALSEGAASQPGRQPLDAAEPALRAAIEAALSSYVSALERGDAEALRAARPDLSDEARASRLSALRGALNVAVDVRVLAIMAVASDARAVRIQRTDVVVGGAAEPQPVEETLRFVERRGAWALE